MTVPDCYRVARLSDIANSNRSEYLKAMLLDRPGRLPAEVEPAYTAGMEYLARLGFAALERLVEAGATVHQICIRRGFLSSSSSAHQPTRKSVPLSTRVILRGRR